MNDLQMVMCAINIGCAVVTGLLALLNYGCDNIKTAVFCTFACSINLLAGLSYFIGAFSS